MRRLIKSLQIACIGSLFAASSLAQITNVTNNTSTPMPGTGHDYIQMLNETVNPANGSVSLRIHTPTPTGRILSIPFTFSYDTDGTHNIGTDPNGIPQWDDNPELFTPSRGGWSYSIPMVTYEYGEKVETGAGYQSTCAYYSGFVFQDGDGDRHALGISSAQPYDGGSVDGCLYPASAVPNAGDDYYRASTGGSWGSPFATVASLDGTVYTFYCAASCYPNNQSSGMIAQRIEDRNGNIITSTNDAQGGFSFADTLGRTVISGSSFASNYGDTITISGLNPYSVAWKAVSSNFSIPTQSTAGNCGVGPESSQRSAISSITLPNGQHYAFLYGTDDPNNSNPYGLLSEIIYPSGGWIKYTYGINYLSDSFSSTEHATDGDYPCGFYYSTPAVTQRTVSFDGQNAALQQTFSYSTTSSPYFWATKQTVVRTQDLVTGQASEIDYAYSPYRISDPPNFEFSTADLIPVEQTITYKDGNGIVLRTVSKSWYDQYLLQSEQEALGSGQTAKTVYSYANNNSIALMTEKDEYDYGQGNPGALLRKTITNYASFPTTPIYSYTPYLFDRPCQVITYDGNGNRSAEQNFLYDGGTNVCGASGAPSTSSVSNLVSGTHDETNYSSGSQTPRGNATQRIDRCFPNCSDAITSFSFDEAGQITSKIDPDLHTTTYEYTDSFSDNTPLQQTDAYLTKITYPQTGSVKHIESFSYAYSDGQLTGHVDQNSHSTTYNYSDPLRRMTDTYVDGAALTHTSYNDLYPPTTTGTQYAAPETGPGNATPDADIISTLQYDGMGHHTKTQVSSDVTYDAIYDGFGRLYTVKNPYRSGVSLSTDGTLSYTYDALGRITIVTKEDGTTTSTDYSAFPTVTVTDETHRKRKTTADALGRLIDVYEPNPISGDLASGFHSSYQYDSLDNLICAVQRGQDSSVFTNCGSAPLTWRPRSFVYDSLSRLTQASNPESGTIIYSYDSSGNLLGKTTPAPNQTGTATVTTSYCYDVLDRVTSKDYVSRSCPMVTPPPPVSYSYDQGPNGTAPIGHRTGMSDTSGQTSWTFDARGRIASIQQTVNGTILPSNNPVSEAIGYGYDRAGAVTTITYPSGRIIHYHQNASGRTDWVYKTDALSGQTIAYVQVNSYTPHGEPGEVVIGNVSGGCYSGALGEFSYNSRLQPWHILYTTADSATAQAEVQNASCSTSSGDMLHFIHSFGDSFAGVSGDNGNVAKISNCIDGNRSQNFTYDALNRISTAFTDGPNWGDQFTIDSWGNLTNIAGLSGKQVSEILNAAPASAKNQLNGWSYDAAGNQLTSTDPLGFTHNYSFDSENRISSLDAGAATYTYSGEGDRIVKNVGGTGTLYWRGADGEILAESDLAGILTSEYVFFNGTRIARTDNPTDSAKASLKYYLSDHLGSTSMITDATFSTVLEDEDYFPYGREVAGGGDNSNHYLFTGKERDSETTLDYFGARYYSSATARWMSPDWAAKPIAVPYANFGNPQSLNLYSYVENNPLGLVDTDGHEIIYANNLKNAQVVKDTVQAILTNPHTSANLSGYVGPNNPNLVIQSGDLSGQDTRTVNPGGSVTTTTVLGDTQPNIQTTSNTSSFGGVTTTTAPETTLQDTTVTIDNRVGRGEVAGVMVHESVHAGEAKADPAKFSKDAAAEKKSYPNCHDCRPQEQRANAAQKSYTNEIKKQANQIEKDRKKKKKE